MRFLWRLRLYKDFSLAKYRRLDEVAVKIGVEEMRKLCQSILHAILCLVTSGYAAVDFIYDGYEQNRSVLSQLDTIYGSEIQQEYTNNLGNFNETSEVVFFNLNSPFESNRYYSVAGQNSWILNDRITYKGWSRFSGPFYHENFRRINLFANYNLKTIFGISNSCQVSLVGELKLFGDYYGTEGYPSFTGYIRLADDLDNELFSIYLPYNCYPGMLIWSIDEIFQIDSNKIYILEGNISLSGSFAGYNPNYHIGGGGGTWIDLSMCIVPEPAAMTLFALGIILIGKRHRSSA